MKQKDIVTIVFAVGIASLLSFFITSAIFKDKVGKLKVEKVDEISTTFPLPDNKYFNDKSLNPTKLIEIQPNNNNTPFANGQ